MDCNPSFLWVGIFFFCWCGLCGVWVMVCCGGLGRGSLETWILTHGAIEIG